MRKKVQHLLWVWLLLPVFVSAQHVTEYRPGVLVSSVVNLESLRGTAPGDPAAGFTRSVNTIQEFAGAVNNDIWFLTTNAAGVVANSFRYGVVIAAGANDRSSAIERCPNGDYIILGITTINNFDRILAFRIPAGGGAPLWANTYYTPNFHTRGYCIKKTNDPLVESYMIAGTNSLAGGASPDKTLVALKINGGGGLLWNSDYFDPVVPNNIFNQPRSMVVVGNNHYIAGNRTLGAARDIFTIAINQAAGAVAVNYNAIDNGGRADFNPYINTSNAGGFILTYSCIANIAAVNTGRVAITPLNGGLAVAGNTGLYWEANTTNNYGHTIYPLPGAGGYGIGGGATVGALVNPTYFQVNNAGAIIAGSYARLWVPQYFIPTFLLDDPLVAAAAANRVAHHAYRPNNNPGGMAIMRNSAACLANPVLNSQFVPNVQLFVAYNRTAPLVPQAVQVQPIVVAGQFFTCGGAVGAFRKPNTTGIEELLGSGSFRIYPSLVAVQTQVNVEVEALQATQGTVRIYNMESQLVQTAVQTLIKGSNRFSLDLGSLPRGTYVVELQSGEQVQRARIVKQ